MNVKALTTGYYDNKRIYHGEMFALTDDAHFSESWMEEVEESGEDMAVAKAKTKPAKVQQAPDARDLNKVIDEALGDKKVQYSGGVRTMGQARVVSPNLEGGAGGEGEDEEGGSGTSRPASASSNTRRRRGLKNLFSESDEKKSG